MDRIDRGAASLQAGDQAAIGDAVFLQTDHQIRYRQLLIERTEYLAPRVRLRHRDRRRDAEFLEHCEWFRATHNRFNIAHRSQETGPIDVSLDLLD